MDSTLEKLTAFSQAVAGLCKRGDALVDALPASASTGHIEDAVAGLAEVLGRVSLAIKAREEALDLQDDLENGAACLDCMGNVVRPVAPASYHGGL